MSDLAALEKTNDMMVARVLDTGGIERDVSKFARHLPAKGFQPHVACFNPGGMRWREIESAGIPTVTVPGRSFRSWSAVTGARLLKEYINKEHIQLIHAFDVPTDMFAVPLGRLWGVPVLSSQLCYRDLCPPVTRVVMSIIDRLATGTFVNCQGIAEHLETEWRVDGKKIHVCYNGYEPAEFYPEGRQRPASLSEASLVVGTVALLRPEKNLRLLVNAFAMLLRTVHRARLLIVGSGPGQAELERQALDLQVRQACIFQPSVEYPAEWMRAIDIFVLPSRSEGFSNSLLEAMACGCCPVASRVGGTPELIEHEQRGLLFDSDNVEALTEALVYLASNPSAMQMMARRA